MDKISLVEDDPTLFRMLSELLSSPNFVILKWLVVMNFLYFDNHCNVLTFSQSNK